MIAGYAFGASEGYFYIRAEYPLAVERIQIAIKNFIGNTGVDWSSILAASVLSILPIVILFVILQKYIVGGVSAGGVKG